MHYPFSEGTDLAILYSDYSIQVGGRNTVLVDALTRKIPLVSDIPTIIFGADVTHPHPGEDSSPSIAAVSWCLWQFIVFHVVVEVCVVDVSLR